MPLTPDQVLSKLQAQLTAKGDEKSLKLLAWMGSNPDRARRMAQDRLDKKSDLAHALSRLDDAHADVYDLFLYSPGPALKAGRSFGFEPADLPNLFSANDKRKVQAIVRTGRKPEWVDETQAKWLLIALTADGAIKKVSVSFAPKELFVWSGQETKDATEAKIAEWFERGARVMLTRPRMSDEDREWVRSVNAEILGSTDLDFLLAVAGYRSTKPLRVRAPFGDTATRRLEALRGYSRWVRKDELRRADNLPKNIAIGTTVTVIAGEHKGLTGVTLQSGASSAKAKEATGTTQAWLVEFPPTVTE